MNRISKFNQNEWIVYASILAVFDIILIFFYFHNFELKNQLLQALVIELVTVSLPLASIFLIWKLRIPKATQILNNVFVSIKVILTVLISFFFLVIVFFTTINLALTTYLGFNPAFEKLQEIKIENNNFAVVYRTNGGATTDFGVEIWQEQEILPGIRLVNQLTDFYHVENIVLEYNGGNQVTIVEVVPTSHPYDQEDIEWYGPLPTAGDTLLIE